MSLTHARHLYQKRLTTPIPQTTSHCHIVSGDSPKSSCLQNIALNLHPGDVMIFGRKYTVTCLFLPSDNGVGVGGGAGHQFPLNSSVSPFYVHRGTDLKESIIWAEDSEWHPQNRPDVSF